MKCVMPFVPYVGASVLARAGATRVLVRFHFCTSVCARAYIKPITSRTAHPSPNIRPVECPPAACRGQPCAPRGRADKSQTAPEHGPFLQRERRLVPSCSRRPACPDRAHGPSHTPGWPRHTCSGPSRDCPAAGGPRRASDRVQSPSSAALRSPPLPHPAPPPPFPPPHHSPPNMR